MRTIVIIPARLAATRLPRKPLLRETGKYMIQHVWERAKAAKRAARAVIATDSREIEDACRSFGAEAIMTSDQHRSGTDRCAEAWAKLQARGEKADIIINVQGDEPELEPANVDRLAELMAEGKSPMGTLVETLADAREAELSQVVKVVQDGDGFCLYFSRAKIPFGATTWLRHVGIYAFTPDFLAKFPTLEPAPLEQTEKLEQLRALHHGYRIRAALVPASGVRGIDTPEDYAAFVARHRARTGMS